MRRPTPTSCPAAPPNADPQGYSVDLCRAVFDTLREELKIPDMKIVYVAVNSQDRFDALTNNKADLLCTSTTATLARRKTVDFSIPIFIDGASFVIRPDGPRDVKLLGGKKVGVLPGTTTEQELRRALTGTKINADIVLVKTNQEGIDLVEKGGVSAYFADRATLTFLLRKEKQAAGLLMAETYLSVEPIALAMRRGDPDFRLAVDTALSHIYRRGEISTVFKMAVRRAVDAQPAAGRPLPGIGLAGLASAPHLSSQCVFPFSISRSPSPAVRKINRSATPFPSPSTARRWATTVSGSPSTTTIRPSSAPRRRS